MNDKKYVATMGIFCAYALGCVGIVAYTKVQELKVIQALVEEALKEK